MKTYDLSNLEKFVCDGEVLDKIEFAKALIPVIADHFGLPKELYTDKNGKVIVPVLKHPGFLTNTRNSHASPYYGYVYVNDADKNYIDAHGEEIGHNLRFLSKFRNDIPYLNALMARDKKYIGKRQDRAEVAEFFGQLGREATIEIFANNPKFSGMFSLAVKGVPKAAQNMLNWITLPENSEKLSKSYFIPNLAAIEDKFAESTNDVDKIVKNGNKILDEWSNAEHHSGYSVGHIFYEKAKAQSPRLWFRKQKGIIEDYFKIKNILHEALKPSGHSVNLSFVYDGGLK